MGSRMRRLQDMARTSHRARNLGMDRTLHRRDTGRIRLLVTGKLLRRDTDRTRLLVTDKLRRRGMDRTLHPRDTARILIRPSIGSSIRPRLRNLRMTFPVDL